MTRPTWLAKTRLEVAGFLIALLGLAVVGVVAFRSTDALVDNARLVAHSHDVLGDLERVLSTVKDAETGQRGYLLTGADRYLEPYTAALSTLPHEIKGLRGLTGDNPDQQRRLDALEPLLAKRLSALAAAMEIRGTAGADAVVRFLLTDEGKRTMDEIRRVVGEMQREERRLLEERSTAAKASATKTKRVVAFGSVLTCALLVLVFSLLKHEIAARTRAENAVATLNEALERRVLERTAQLEAAHREIIEINEDLERRVSIRTAQLEAANGELEAFSYSVSHDLRAPLRAIDGFSRILVEDYASRLDDEARDYLQRVRDSATHMGTLIDDLLAFSRLSRQPLTAQTVEPRDVVRRVLADLETHHAGRCVEISVGDLPPCRGDASLLRQVFANLLSNAFKYTRERETARIDIGSRVDEARPDEVVYFVTDNGAGFDMRYAHKLFGVFQRLHRAEEFEGTGVGLAIVHRIITRHGGRVWAEGEVDRGATFSFTVNGGTPHV